MRREASTPEGVYSAQDIAGQQELEAMERHIDREAKAFEVSGGSTVPCGGGCDSGGYELRRCVGTGSEFFGEYRVDQSVHFS